MSAPRKGSELAAIHSLMCKALKIGLEGEPLLNDEGQPIMLDGKAVRVYKAGLLKEAREFLKDNGIDAEASEGSDLESLAKTVKAFDDDEPLMIPERDGVGSGKPKGSIIN